MICLMWTFLAEIATFFSLAIGYARPNTPETEQMSALWRDFGERLLRTRGLGP
jgi:hypothetical protein